MNIKEAEILLQAGALTLPVIKKYDQDGGWVVTLAGKHKLNPVLETARGQVRVFKTLYAAVGVLFDLGFGEIRVIRYFWIGEGYRNLTVSDRPRAASYPCKHSGG